MAQLTIYVSDEVAERVRTHRERVNVSQVCARALRQELRIVEVAERQQDLGLDGATLGGVLERLRADKARSVHADEQEGVEHAREWVKTGAAYAELKQYGEWEPQGHNFYESAFGAFGFTLPEDVIAWLRETNRDAVREGNDPIEFTAFARGWHGYVRQFWAAVGKTL
jgi:hypothetical protein